MKPGNSGGAKAGGAGAYRHGISFHRPAESSARGGPGRWMRDDQEHGTTTRESAVGSTSGTSFTPFGSSVVAVGEIVCVDRPHVGDSDSGTAGGKPRDAAWKDVQRP